MRKKIHDMFFELYLKLEFSDLNNVKNWQRPVYDHLGPIDTLGSHGSEGIFTFSYSCEAYSEFGIILKPFPLAIIYHTGLSKYMYIRLLECKFRRFINRLKGDPDRTFKWKIRLAYEFLKIGQFRTSYKYAKQIL